MGIEGKIDSYFEGNQPPKHGEEARTILTNFLNNLSLIWLVAYIQYYPIFLPKTNQLSNWIQLNSS